MGWVQAVLWVRMASWRWCSRTIWTDGAGVVGKDGQLGIVLEVIFLFESVHDCQRSVIYG